MATIDTVLILKNTIGLHARPASQFVQTAARFKSMIQVECNGRRADAKRILQVLQLGAEYGAELHVHAEGDDATEAVAALGELVDTRFGEAA